MKIKHQYIKTTLKKHPFSRFISGEVLNLSGQSLTDEDIPDIIQFLSYHPYINKLDLSLNNIGDQGLVDFAERNHTIVEANFSGNLICDMGILAFARMNQMLKQVNFSRNRISDSAVIEFAEKNQTVSSCQFTVLRYH
jgi:hypothetical protein